MPVHTFTSTIDLSLCTHDHHIEIVEGQVRLKPRILLADDIGAVTQKTYEVIRGNVCARKTFRLSYTDIRQAEAVLRIDPIADEKLKPGTILKMVSDPNRVIQIMNSYRQK